MLYRGFIPLLMKLQWNFQKPGFYNLKISWNFTNFLFSLRTSSHTSNCTCVCGVRQVGRAAARRRPLIGRRWKTAAENKSVAGTRSSSREWPTSWYDAAVTSRDVTSFWRTSSRCCCCAKYDQQDWNCRGWGFRRRQRAVRGEGGINLLVHFKNILAGDGCHAVCGWCQLLSRPPVHFRSCTWRVHGENADLCFMRGHLMRPECMIFYIHIYV